MKPAFIWALILCLFLLIGCKQKLEPNEQKGLDMTLAFIKGYAQFKSLDEK